MLGNFGARGQQEHGRELCADFLWLFACAQFSLAVLSFCGVSVLSEKKCKTTLINGNDRRLAVTIRGIEKQEHSKHQTQTRPSDHPNHRILLYLSGFLKRALAQTCLGALVPSTVFKKNLWAFLGPCVRERGRTWYGTSAQPESHFTYSSPKGAPWVVPSASLLNYFWAFLGPWGRARGRPWYGTFKPRSHFTEGMFEKR